MVRTISMTLNGVKVQAMEGETILSVANRKGVFVPTLCALEGKPRLESCGVCAVKVEGNSNLVPACASRVSDQMVVWTDTPEVVKARKDALELLLSDHVGDCSAPCELTCPAGIDIPGFLRLIARSRFADALAVIERNVAFPGVLGRICPRYCEKACRRAIYDESLAICALKRFPADWCRVNGARINETVAPSGKRVGIIGGGFAGLSLAWFLMRDGHQCHVYERTALLGGAMRRFIPEFRLPAEVVDWESDVLAQKGLVIHTGAEISDADQLQELRSRYDAVCLATGAMRETRGVFPGSEFCQDSLTFLSECKSEQARVEQGSAVVLGSGAASLDVCRCLVRQGYSSVTFLQDNTAGAGAFYRDQVQDTQDEGVLLEIGCSVREVKPNGDGRLLCEIEQAGERKAYPATSVVFAGHLENDPGWLGNLGLHTTNFGVEVDAGTLQTNLEGVFATGSVVRPNRHAVHCSDEARRVAVSVSRYLSNASAVTRKTLNVRMTKMQEDDKRTFFDDRKYQKRAGTGKMESSESRTSWGERDAGLSEKDAVPEAQRCLDCDCAAKERCLLRIHATDYGASSGVYQGQKPPFARDSSHPDVVYESGKCIKCGRCIAVAEEHQAPVGLSYIGRGFDLRVAPPFERSLLDALGDLALKCVEVCPTGALSARERV